MIKATLFHPGYPVSNTLVFWKTYYL